MSNITKNLIKRDLQAVLRRELNREIISTIIGPRQVGKTTLLEQLALDLQKEGINPHYIISLNFDDLELRSRLATRPGELSREIEIRLGVPLSNLKEKVYLFLDEAQKLPPLLEEVKLLFDRYKERIKIVISGSSSLEVRKNVAESLAGRIRYHYLFGLTIKEVLVYYRLWSGGPGLLELLLREQLNKQNIKKIQAEIWEQRDSIGNLRRRMLIFGSLPAVFMEPSEEERWFMLRDYAATYIEKDIRVLGGVGDLDLFQRLYRALLLQNANLLNVSNLASDLGISRNTIDSYLGILEQTHVISRLLAWAKRPKPRLVKAPKIYFFDNGLVNHATRQTDYQALQAGGRLGAAEEGLFFFNTLSFSAKLSLPPEIHFWRDYRGHEMDFVIKGRELRAVEVTTEKRTRKKRYRNIVYMEEKTGIRQVIIAGDFSSFEELTVGLSHVIKIPFWMVF